MSYSYKHSTRCVIFKYSSFTADVNIYDNYPETLYLLIFIYLSSMHVDINGYMNIIQADEIKKFCIKGTNKKASRDNIV